MDHQKQGEWMSKITLYGVIIAITVMLIGAICYLYAHGNIPIETKTFEGQPSNLTSLSGIFTSALHGESRAIIQLGIVLLLLNPFVRLLYSAITFAMMKNRKYTIISLVVLVMLLISLLH